jgi:hypothetical protein
MPIANPILQVVPFNFRRVLDYNHQINPPAAAAAPDDLQALLCKFNVSVITMD